MRVPQIPHTTSDRGSVSGRRRARTAALAALTCTGILATAGAAPAGAAPVAHPSLDAVAPVAVTVQGTRVAWLRPTSTPTKSGVKSTQIVVVDKAGDAPRTLAVTTPAYADELALGTDAKGRVVLTVGSRSGTFVVRTDGTSGLRKLAGQTSRDDHAVMRTGAVAFTRTSGSVTTVRTAPAAGKPSKALYRVPKGYSAEQLAFGIKGAVALHTYRPVDVGIGDVVSLLRPGKSVLKLTSQSTGGASENGVGTLTSTANGSRFGVSRWNVGGGHPNDLQRFSSATGKRTTARDATVDPGAEAVDELQFDDGRSVITSVLGGGTCNAPGDAPKPDQPACLGLGFVG